MYTKHWIAWCAWALGVWLGQVAAMEPVMADDEPTPEADAPGIGRLLETIDVGPYQVPALALKKDHNYAHSATDVEPFRHVTPFREHFLEQMEYTGPGRAIPEPAVAPEPSAPPAAPSPSSPTATPSTLSGRRRARSSTGAPPTEGPPGEARSR